MRRNGLCLTPLASAEIYNPTAGVFTATGSLNPARDGQATSSLKGGQVLTEGGLSLFCAVSATKYYVPLTISMPPRA
jgi:hypothetical protein